MNFKHFAIPYGVNLNDTFEFELRTGEKEEVLAAISPVAALGHQVGSGSAVLTVDPTSLRSLLAAGNILKDIPKADNFMGEIQGSGHDILHLREALMISRELGRLTEAGWFSLARGSFQPVIDRIVGADFVVEGGELNSLGNVYFVLDRESTTVNDQITGPRFAIVKPQDESDEILIYANPSGNDLPRAQAFIKAIRGDDSSPENPLSIYRIFRRSRSVYRVTNPLGLAAVVRDANYDGTFHPKLDIKDIKYCVVIDCAPDGVSWSVVNV